MIELLGTSLGVFIAVTVVVLGFAACMSGVALANTWRPMWHAVPYCLLLGCADRFLTFALFEGTLLSLSGYLIDTLVLLVICTTAYRLTLVRKMVTQYPWLYERAGPLSWRQRGAK
jgi:hypothetical protein